MAKKTEAEGAAAEAAAAEEGRRHTEHKRMKWAWVKRSKPACLTRS